jgi:gliding motility-associated-like protein
LPVPTVTGSNSVCVGTTGVTYSTEAGMSNYVWTVSSGGTITAGAGTQQITVTWNTAGANTVTVNYQNANSCTATTPTSYNVTVNALPVPTITGSNSVCHNTTQIYTTEAGMSNYVWTVSVGGTITSGGSATDNNVTVTWSTVGAQTVGVTYSNAAGCSATAPTSLGITVKPLPVPTITGQASVCQNSSVVYSTEAGMSGYAWTVTGGTITAGAGTRQITVTWNSVGAQTVSVNYVGSNSCSAASATVYPVTVNALPVPTITGSNSVCVGTTGVTYSTEAGMSNYVWTVSSGGTITAGAGTQQITVTWNTAGAQSVTVNYQDANGCSAASPSSFSISVNQVDVTLAVNPPASPTNTKVCVGMSVTYQATASLGTGPYTYNFEQRLLPAGVFSSVQNSASNIYTTATNLIAGQYELRVTVTDATTGCSSNVTASSFEVVALPSITLASSSNSICLNSNVTLTATPAGFNNYTFNIDGSSIDNGVNNILTTNTLTVGTHNVYVTASNGSCSASSTPLETISVNPLPSTTLVSDKPVGTVCENEVVTFTASGASTYEFYVGGISQGAASATNTFTYSSLNNFSVTVKGIDGNLCESTTAPINITISKPVATITASQNPICAGTAVAFNATGGISYTFEINNSNAVTQASSTFIPSSTINNNDNVSVIATDTYGCVSPEVSVTMVVNSIPSVSIVSDKTGDAVCLGSPITFTASSDIVGAAEYEFFVNGASVQARGGANVFTTNTLANGDDVYAIAYNNATDCNSASPSINVTVNTLPSISIETVNPGTSIIEGTSVTFTATLISGATYSWDVDGTVVQAASPSNTFTTTTLTDGNVVTVTVTDSNGCQSSASVTIHVYDTIQPLPVVVSPDGYCITSSTGVDISVANPQAGVIYNLYRVSDNQDLGVGSVVGSTVIWTNIKNTGVGVDSYRVDAYQSAVPTVIITMSNTVTVTEYALPLVFDMSPIGTVTDCNGGSGYTITLSGSEIGVTYTLLRDGSIHGAPLNGTGNALSFGTTSTGGTYTIVATLDVINGCSQTMNNSFTLDLSSFGIQYNLLSDRADGLFCQGGTGVRIFLDDSQNGIDYTLVRDGVIDVITITGTGNSIDFGTFTTEGTYSAVVRQGGCNLAMNGSVNVTAIAPPNQYTLSVTNNGHYCAGSAGVTLTIDGQQNGYTYSLYRDAGILVESIVSSSAVESTPLQFTRVNIPENYYVTATSNGPGCPSNMLNSQDVIEDEVPAEVTLVSDLPVICAGSSTVLYIPNSRNNTDYYLLLGGVETGIMVSGNDGRVDFPSISNGGAYTLRAISHHQYTDCESYLATTQNIVVSTLPSVRFINVTDGTTCSNGTIVVVESSENGIIYEVYNATTNSVISPAYSLTGDGNDITFPAIVASDNHYYVVARNANGCTLNIARNNGDADIHVQIPGVVNSYAVAITPTSRCIGDNSGFVVRLFDSEANVTYELLDASNNILQTVVSTGGAFDFAGVTVAGNYTVRGYHAADPSCMVGMLNSVDAVYNSLPVVTLTASPGTTIIEGTNVLFTGTGAVSYEFIRQNLTSTIEQAVSVDDTYNSTTINNNDSIIVTGYNLNGCQSRDTVVMTVLKALQPQPITASAYNYCESDNGVTIMVANPVAGVTYELFHESGLLIGAGTFDGNVVRWDNVQNESALSSETYSVNGYYTAYPTIVVPIGTVIITEQPQPTVLTFATQSFSDCNGGAGYPLTLSGTENGVDYELLLNGNPTGNIQQGNGGDLTFNCTFIGVYTVRATNHLANSCTQLMTGSLTIAIANTVNVYDLLSTRADGLYCEGSTGVDIYLSNSDLNVSYQLTNSNGTVITPVSGTGNSVSFGLFTEESVYTASVDVSGCPLPMNNSVTVTMVDSPKKFNIIAENSGHFCANDVDGINISLDGQQNGYEYTLTINGVPSKVITASSPSENSILDFGLFNEEGEYIISAKNPLLGCTVDIDTVNVVIDPLPVIYAFVATSTTYCTGGSTTLYIPNSAVGTDYYLIKDGIILNTSMVSGNGNRIDFTVNQAGSYGIFATRNNTNTACSSTLDASLFINITEAALPQSRLITVLDGIDCNNGTIVTVLGTEAGVTYQIYSTTTNLPLSGYSFTGDGTSDIAFIPLIDKDGHYYVVASNALGCQLILARNDGNSDVYVNIPGAVKKFTLTQPASICLGDDGVIIGLDGSEVGINYTLHRVNSSVDIQTITGDGNALTFNKVINEDVYYVTAIDAINPACTNEMLNRVTVKYNPLPKAFNLTGSGFYCDAAEPAIIGIEHSEWEVDYTLIYKTATGKDFIATIPGSYYGDSIFFNGVATDGVYTVYARTLLGCTSSMKDSVVVTLRSAPTVFNVSVPDTAYCGSQGGADVYLSGMQKDVTYQVVNTIANQTSSITGSVDAITSTFLTQLQVGTFDILATWGGDACSVKLNTKPIIITTAPVATIAPKISIQDNTICQGQIDTVFVDNTDINTVYDLVIDGVIQGLDIKGDTVPTAAWQYNGTVGVTQIIEVIAYLDGYKECAVRSENVVFVDTKASPKLFDVSPQDSTYCLGLPGVNISVSGSEADVFYELINSDTNQRVDYYMPLATEVPNGFTFRDPAPEGQYVVTGRYMSGGCTSQMNFAADIKEDDGSSSSCIPLVAVDDIAYLSSKSISDTAFVSINDTINPIIDIKGTNLKYTIILDDGNGNATIGTVIPDNNLTGEFIYTKVAGFYGRDYFRYILENTDIPNRKDTALVMIMVGNKDIPGGSLLIPNAFSPNGDDYNQRYEITGSLKEGEEEIDVTDSRVKSSLEVFNRWGTMVYRSVGDHYNNDWDGTNQGNMVSIGSELPVGTYFFVFKITFNLNGGTKTIKRDYSGYIELRR